MCLFVCLWDRLSTAAARSVCVASERFFIAFASKRSQKSRSQNLMVSGQRSVNARLSSVVIILVCCVRSAGWFPADRGRPDAESGRERTSHGDDVLSEWQPRADRVLVQGPRSRRHL